MVEIIDEIKLNEEKVHPWRLCPKGTHFVSEHLVHTAPNKKYPNGHTSVCHAHCAKNPSKKDELSFYEIQYISQKYFDSLTGAPTPILLKTVFKHADDFDSYIRGWVIYWNDVLKPSEPLDPNLVKALIGTESSFLINPPPSDNAHGLMQIKYNTSFILKDPGGELKDYLIRIEWDKILDPSTNICMGIRWLFQKKKLASLRLKREATWEEAIIEYKGLWDKLKDKELPKALQRLREYYQILTEELS